MGRDEHFAGGANAELVLERNQLGELAHEQENEWTKTSS
jgi:hypothetical protein